MPTIQLNNIDFKAYATLEQANAYAVGSTRFDLWDGVDEDLRKRYLIEAYRLISRQGFVWGTEEPTPEQLEVLVAVSTEVGFLLATGDEEVLVSAGGASNVKRARGGSAEVEFFMPREGSSSRFPAHIQELLNPLLGRGIGAGLTGGGFVSGVDELSTARDRPGLLWTI